MPPQEFAISAPTTEEMTKVVIAGAGAGVTGAVQGVVVKMAPQLGALEPIFTWGTLLGVPVLGAAAAMFTKGMLSDLAMGVACGGLGVVGYTLPELMAPIIPIAGRGRGQLPAGAGVKQLMAGPLGAPQRAQSQARVGIEF